MEQKWLRPSEVAAMFKVNPKTVRRWVQADKLKARKTLGGHCRFDVDEVGAHLEKHKKA
jgi:excisionase family DNA binding protein